MLRYSRLFACALLIFLFAAFAAAPRPRVVHRAPAKTLKASATVRRWMKTMTLRDKVAQLVFISFHGASYNSRSREYRKFVRLIRDTRVGGLILVNWANGRTIQKAEPYALAAFINRMQRLARVPLLVSGDFERGASMRVDGTTMFPHAMAFGAAGDPALTRFEGEVTAREARALGVQWVFYPVADVNNNPDNPVINIRSFGEDPHAVAAQVRAFIEGTRVDKRSLVLTSVKHFPGHGDTAVDTHMALAVVNADRERLNKMELIPFRAAIDAGVDSVMTAHLAVPALAEPDVPATLSSAILTKLLRDDLGFTGLVITDALEMGAIVKGFGTGEAAVKALEAGADILLMPPDPDAAIKAVLAAVTSGRLKEDRIDESVAKILGAKEKVGLDHKRFVDLEAIGDVIDAPESNEKAQQVSERALTLVRNERGVFPAPAPERTCYVVMPETRYSSGGQVFTQEVKKRARGANVVSLDGSMLLETVDAALQQMSSCESFAVAAFAPVAAYRGNLTLSGELPHALDALIATGKPVSLISLGNPYLLRAFPGVSSYLATFSSVPFSEIAAVRALFGEIPVTGHMPVTIPGLAKLGDGIQLQARKPGGVAVTQ